MMCHWRAQLHAAARIVVEAQDRQWTRRIHAGGTSIASSGPPEAHFGLGDVQTVDAMTIYWPDGTTHDFFDIPVNQMVAVQR